MPAPYRYEPPVLVLFADTGQVPVGVGFTCNIGPKAADATCSAGWTAANKCGSGCTAQNPSSNCVSGVTVKGCTNGYSANSCNSGTSGPYGGGCGLMVCCTGSGGSNWSTCKFGDGNFGACNTGDAACGEVCLTYDLCNPPS